MVHDKIMAARNVSSPAHDLPFGDPLCVPTGESDFLDEVHAERRGAGMIQLFGETMSKKNSNKADAQQTKG